MPPKGNLSWRKSGVIWQRQTRGLVLLLPTAVVWGARDYFLVLVRCCVLGCALLGRRSAEGIVDLIGCCVTIHGQFRAHAIQMGNRELRTLQLQMEHAIIGLWFAAQVVFMARLCWQRFVGRHIGFQLQELLLPLALLKLHNANL